MITGNDKYTFKLSGSEETHDRMTETAVKFNEKLSKRGKSLQELSKDEFVELIHEASGK